MLECRFYFIYACCWYLIDIKYIMKQAWRCWLSFMQLTWIWNLKHSWQKIHEVFFEPYYSQWIKMSSKKVRLSIFKQRVNRGMHDVRLFAVNMIFNSLYNSFSCGSNFSLNWNLALAIWLITTLETKPPHLSKWTVRKGQGLFVCPESGGKWSFFCTVLWAPTHFPWQIVFVSHERDTWN